VPEFPPKRPAKLKIKSEFPSLALTPWKTATPTLPLSSLAWRLSTAWWTSLSIAGPREVRKNTLPGLWIVPSRSSFYAEGPVNLEAWKIWLIWSMKETIFWVSSLENVSTTLWALWRRCLILTSECVASQYCCCILNIIEPMTTVLLTQFYNEGLYYCCRF